MPRSNDAVQTNRSLASLQVLRAVAALMVVGAHIFDQNGIQYKLYGHAPFSRFDVFLQSGVDLFFVISGFIMLVTTSRAVRGTAGASVFIIRRITRVYPAYFVVTFVIWIAFLNRPDLVNVSQAIPPDPLSSFLLLPQAGLPLLLVGWTLTYEMYFYCIFALGLLFPRGLFKWIIVAWTTAVLVASLVPPSSNLYIKFLQNPLSLEFSLGVIVGYAYLSATFRFAILAAITACTALIVLITYSAVGQLDAQPFPFFRVIFFGTSYAVLLYAATALEAIGRVRPRREFAYLGDSSYSLYLTHVLVLKAVTLLVPILGLGVSAEPLIIVLAFVASVLGGVVYFRLVERPLLRLIHDPVRKLGR